MSAVLQKDFRKQPCPKCGEVGGIELDFATSSFYCVKCGAKAIDPWESAVLAEPEPPKKLAKKKEAIVPDPRPAVPSGAGIRDVIEDYYVPHKNGEPILIDGKPQRVLVSRAYCPKNFEKDESKFDPNTPAAQFYLRIHAKRFKNRRRYDRDIKRRRGGLPSNSESSVLSER